MLSPEDQETALYKILWNSRAQAKQRTAGARQVLFLLGVGDEQYSKEAPEVWAHQPVERLRTKFLERPGNSRTRFKLKGKAYEYFHNGMLYVDGALVYKEGSLEQMDVFQDGQWVDDLVSISEDVKRVSEEARVAAKSYRDYDDALRHFHEASLLGARVTAPTKPQYYRPLENRVLKEIRASNRNKWIFWIIIWTPILYVIVRGCIGSGH